MSDSIPPIPFRKWTRARKVGTAVAAAALFVVPFSAWATCVRMPGRATAGRGARDDGGAGARRKGYKTHLGADLDSNLVVACAVTPANKPEADALPAILHDLAQHRDRNTIASLHIDRGYLASEAVRGLSNAGVPILSKPWRGRTGPLYNKSDFKLNLGRRTITCPAGHTDKIQLDTTVHFRAAKCDACPVRSKCRDAVPGRGRGVTIAPDELLQKKLRSAIGTRSGREALRDRVTIEHRLAHHASKQGPRARYLGTRNNTFDSRRHAPNLNLEQLQLAEAA